ncbi:hypothetical protein [Bordetella genomosp. 12]|nr:hypothetical protein [Bordetella genomosp. 12]
MGEADFYQIAMQEFDSGAADAELLAQAWVKAQGSDTGPAQRLEYVKLRVAQLKAAHRRRAATQWGRASRPLLARAGRLAALALKLLVWVACVALISQALDDTRWGPSNMLADVIGKFLVIWLLAVLFERLALALVCWLRPQVGRMRASFSAMLVLRALSGALATALVWAGQVYVQTQARPGVMVSSVSIVAAALLILPSKALFWRRRRPAQASESPAL